MTSSLMSHVGFFFNPNNVFKVFHIDLKSNVVDKNNDVMISGINDFFYLNDCDVLAGEFGDLKMNLVEVNFQRCLFIWIVFLMLKI